jgi:LPXTG-site transpeptidase (sortase) family protein
MRRALGTALIVVGVLVLSGVGYRYARGAYDRDQARAAWAALEAHDAVASANSLASAHSHTTYAPGALVGRLLIPAVQLDEVIAEGVGDDQLDAGPGHLPGSASPGEPGNAVISAHRDRHFHSLGRVVVGDTVITETRTSRTTWVIVNRSIVGRYEPSLFPSEQPELTLTTCWPIRYIGPAPDRLILTAKPIVVPPRA